MSVIRFVICLTGLLFARSTLAQGFSAEESVRRMKVAEGFEVRLVASEPQILQPIFVKFDDRGLLWTIQYLQYPNPAGLKRVKVDRWSRTVYDRVPEPPPRGPRGADKISVLIDKDHDGRTDEVKDVITGLNLCTGLEFGHGGLFVLQVPYLLFYPDKNGDDIPDADPEVLLTGFGMEDAQSFANHLTWGPDGWLYGVNGSTTTCRIRGLEFQQGVWRYHPVTKAFELFCEGGGNLYGLSFDAEGNLIYTGNGGYLAFHALQGAYYLKTFGKHGPLHNPHAYGYFSDIKKDGAVPGAPSTGGTIYLAENRQTATTNDKGPRTKDQALLQNSLVSGNFLGHSISWWKLSPLGATFGAKHQGLLVDAQDTWCCPTDLCLGPDGAIYWADFHDQRTAHPDPDANWDRTNGRIYRIVAKGAAAPGPVNLREMNNSDLLKQLDQPGWHADRARVILAERRDATLHADLRQRLTSEPDHLKTLQYLWALHVSGGLDDGTLLRMLDHPAPSVRRWAVRLLGDPKQTTDAAAERLIKLSRDEADITVRCQLAATAKRLPEIGLLIFGGLLSRDADRVDPQLSLLLWWALESQAIAQREAIVTWHIFQSIYNKPAWQFQLEKLIRRYASDGTLKSYDACAKLLRDGDCPAELNQRFETALRQGLSERAQGPQEIGQGDFLAAFSEVGSVPRPVIDKATEPVTGPLLEIIRSRYQKHSESSELSRLALLSGDAELKQELLSRLAKGDQDQTKTALAVLEELGDADCVPVVLPLLDTKSRLPALRVLARFDRPDIISKVIALYPSLNADEKRAAQDLCLRRPAGTLALLSLVDAGTIPPAEIPLDQLRLVSLHGDEHLNGLVRKHWGNLQPGTSEEKLATVRRFKNDLRAAGGNAERGKPLFVKHCATCHKLFNEGGVVGPDLTPANRGDRDFLLVSIVDPNSVIRSQYLNYVATTKGGAILQGVMAEQDAASVTLLDAKGQRHALARAEIDDLKEATASLMPERLLEPLTPQELRDLFAYLETKAR